MSGDNKPLKYNLMLLFTDIHGASFFCYEGYF